MHLPQLNYHVSVLEPLPHAHSIQPATRAVHTGPRPTRTVRAIMEPPHLALPLTEFHIPLTIILRLVSSSTSLTTHKLILPPREDWNGLNDKPPLRPTTRPNRPLRTPKQTSCISIGNPFHLVSAGGHGNIDVRVATRRERTTRNAHGCSSPRPLGSST